MGYRADNDALLMQVEALRRELENAQKNSSEQRRIKKELESKINTLKESRITDAEKTIAADHISARATQRGVLLTLLFLICVASIVVLGIKKMSANPLQNRQKSGNWFTSIKPKCNSTEVKLAVQRNPPPNNWQGQADLATCYALAHKIDESRKVLQNIDSSRQSAATQRLFHVVHPVADAGDDVAAGPVMEMVVEFTPQNFMAVYHAGISAHQTGRPNIAKDYLNTFLKLYSPNDHWKKNALNALEEIEEKNRPAEQEF